MPRPLIRISPVEWLVMRYDEAVPAAVIRKVHLTANGQCADKYRAVTFALESTERKLIGYFDNLDDADDAVLWPNRELAAKDRRFAGYPDWSTLTRSG
jgi:hypothetical protein